MDRSGSRKKTPSKKRVGAINMMPEEPIPVTFADFFLLDALGATVVFWKLDEVVLIVSKSNS